MSDSRHFVNDVTESLASQKLCFTVTPSFVFVLEVKDNFKITKHWRLAAMASCTVNLFGRVEFGHIFSIICKPLADCKNFKINFTDGGVEIPFTIFVNARLKEIVMSSFLNSEWRESVKVKIGQIDSFVPGTSFKFYILASEKKFHVAFNEQHLSDFSYHTSVESIRSVQISGDLERITQVDHRRAFPSAWPPIQEDFETVSFSSDVPFEFSPGSLIVLKMRVTGAPNGSFFIRFNERGTKKQLFQFNPRFANRTVVVNTMTDSLK